MNALPTQRSSIHRRYAYPAAAFLLLLGLAVAIAYDAQLKGPMRLAWFSVLLGLDAVVAMWLTRGRPSDAQHGACAPRHTPIP